jgi:hypothetical protein
VKLPDLNLLLYAIDAEADLRERAGAWLAALAIEHGA